MHVFRKLKEGHSLLVNLQHLATSASSPKKTSRGNQGTHTSRELCTLVCDACLDVTIFFHKMQVAIEHHFLWTQSICVVFWVQNAMQVINIDRLVKIRVSNMSTSKDVQERENLHGHP